MGGIFASLQGLFLDPYLNGIGFDLYAMLNPKRSAVGLRLPFEFHG